MHLIFEEDGHFKAGSILSESDATAQVETASGKRSKIKAATILLRFVAPAPGEVMAEAGAISEYIVEKFGQQGRGDVAHLQPPVGSPAYRQCRYWMHYAEGSLMNWLVMKLVFVTIPKRPMPFFVRPIARGLCAKVQATLIDPNLQAALAFIEGHLGTHRWFAGPEITMADFQMSFAVEALLSRTPDSGSHPHLHEYLKRMRARPAYQRAEAKGGPTLMAT